MKAVNLLPSDLRGAPKASAAITARPDVPRGPGAFIVLGALAFGVVALAGYVLTSNTIKQRHSDIAQLTARQQAAEQRATALKPFAEFQQLADTRVATLKDLAGQRFDWDQTLRDLSRALPANVTIKSLDGSLSGADSTGASASQGAPAGPSITLSGCTTTQSSVARLMARLRDVNGVTSVSLSSSEKKETAVNTAPSETSSTSSEAPCGEGRRPDFKVVIHFENATATAAASGATPAPASALAAGAQAATTPASTAETSATPTPTATPTPAGGTQTSSTTNTPGGEQ